MSGTSEEIRSAGPGRFATIIDQVVYTEVHENGATEELDAPGFGWHALLVLDDPTKASDALNTVEQEFLRPLAGCILAENSDGVVSVDYIPDQDELTRAWEQVRQDYDVFSEDTDMDETPAQVTSSLLDDIEQQGEEDARTSGAGRGSAPSDPRIDEWRQKGVSSDTNPREFERCLNAWRKGVYRVVFLTNRCK